MVKSHFIIHMEDLIILHGHDILYGIPYSEACNQQGCAAAYSDDHHKETLLISEYIPDGNLLQKFEPVPESRDPFKENPLACRRSLGPYQLSRGFAKFLVENGVMTQAEVDAADAQVAKEIEDAIAFADAQPLPDVETAVVDVYSDIVEEVRDR